MTLDDWLNGFPEDEKDTISGLEFWRAGAKAMLDALVERGFIGVRAKRKREEEIMIQLSDAMFGEIMGLLRCITTGTSLSGESKGKADVVLSLLSKEKDGLVDLGGGIYAAGSETRDESLAEKYGATQEQVGKYREELAKAMNEINDNLRTSSLLTGMSASIGESSSREHSYDGEDEYHYTEEPKASQNDYLYMLEKIEKLNARLDALETDKNGLNGMLERINERVIKLEDKVGGRCCATGASTAGDWIDFMYPRKDVHPDAIKAVEKEQRKAKGRFAQIQEWFLRMDDRVCAVERKLGDGRCYATIHANGTMSGEDGRKLP